MYFATYMTTFWYLLLTDLTVFKQNIRHQLLDMLIWASTITLVFTYLMPAFGLASSYSSFMIASLCASGSLFNIFPSVMNLVNDFDGDRIISYHLTLPLPSWLVFVRLMLFYAISGMAMSIVVLPWCKLIVGSNFDLSQMNIFQYLLIFIASNMFFGTFTLFLATCVPNVTKIGRIWMRILYPMWFLGGFQFSWDVLHTHVPVLAYLNLLNPFVYIMEGTRVAILGAAASSINCYLAVVVLLCYCGALGMLALKRMKRRLDFV
jgi:ABC-type polysaccharide/polyol phosphate export permease